MVRKLIRCGSGGGVLTAAALAGFANYKENSGTVKHPDMEKWRIEGPLKDPTDGALIARRVRKQ